MYSFESIDLDTYRGDEYFLAGFVEPKPSEGEDYNPDEDAEEYGVTVARTAPTPIHDKIEIIRMDNKHGQPHMDLEYLPPDTSEQTKVWLDDNYNYSRMKRFLLANWKDYVDLYIEYNE